MENDIIISCETIILSILHPLSPHNMHIVIDERERDLYSKIDSIVNLEGNNTSIQLSREVLPLGDIVIQTDSQRNVVLIERKSFSDLLASIKDGRYEEQSYRLIHSGEHSPHNIIYIIEGMFSQLRTPMEKKIILSAITSLNHFKGFSVIRTCSLNETADTIVWMAEKMEKEFQKGKRAAYTLNRANSDTSSPINPLATDLGELTNENVSSSDYCSVVKKVKKENITPENIGEILLCQIPGISTVTAIAVMKKYGTFPKLIEEIKTNPGDLENIVCENGGKSRKISKSCVKNILAFLTTKPEYN
jgi:ERCC4-type nuclease